ncbi:MULTISPECIES: DUF3043 domain-containing protein [unclassified Microcella]|uniref:DUF3043 domain-containing protein n=1 Tax=unclassified Microcella TaxID=2630066 RepID=UPI0007014386|nr:MULTISPECIES: DUF3043 domain-containing protein [unclassified Microcella]KQV25129.1 hypothetical protein ASC54_11795 [Yonghaparkia sp. Root332]KRF31411.1 hypothetical protein ASG83_11600 [Yonghaparkia sp. Soil809]
MAPRDNADAAAAKAGTTASTAADSREEAAAIAAGKGRPTPSRREREAARKRPLVPNDRKEAAKAARAKMNEARDRARIGMANGEERYLPTRDKGPQKRFVRDYVDARWGVGEFMIPVMFAVILLSFVPTLDVYAILALWAFFLVAVLDATILGFLVKRRLAEKFGADRVEKGVRWYAAMRSLQLRALRLPKPQVRRGQFPA